MMYIESFSCLTSTAQDPEEFWQALCSSKTGIQLSDTTSWPDHMKSYWENQTHEPISCQMKWAGQTYLENFSQSLITLAVRCLKEDDPGKLGIILSTTKGAIEDFVWDEHFKDSQVDPLYAVLEKTLAKLPHTFSYTQVVSNSCASSHASFALAQKWIDSGICQKVLVLAGDLIGPFIHTGFQSLKALSQSGGRPFQEDRDGLVLGEAMTAVLFSSEKSPFELVDVQISNEAFTVTGPSPEGRGLQNCVNKLAHHQLSPDFAVAHGTATIMNDLTEDAVLLKSQQMFHKAFAITGTKWSIGHTLGASGSMDLIAALMCLKHQMVFSLPGQKPADHLKAQNYVFGVNKKITLDTALVTSLGFGGTNGALLVRRTQV